MVGQEGQAGVGIHGLVVASQLLAAGIQQVQHRVDRGTQAPGLGLDGQNLTRPGGEAEVVRIAVAVDPGVDRDGHGDLGRGGERVVGLGFAGFGIRPQGERERVGAGPGTRAVAADPDGADRSAGVDAGQLERADGKVHSVKLHERLGLALASQREKVIQVGNRPDLQAVDEGIPSPVEDVSHLEHVLPVAGDRERRARDPG